MTDQERTIRRAVVTVGRRLSIPVAGIAVVATGEVFGELTAGKNLLCGLLAMLGTASMVYPGWDFDWSAPRQWFAGRRPGPSTRYLSASRVLGAILLVLSVLGVLLIPGSAYD